MFEQILAKVGLSTDEVKVYELLLKEGELPARAVITGAGLKRGTAYYVLKGLKNKGLLEQFEKHKKAYFRLEPPSRIRDYIEAQGQRLKETSSTVEAVIPQMLSQYNLVLHKPGVRFFEGDAGVKAVAFDSLSSTTEIYSYIDNEAVNKYIADVNREYLKGSRRVKIRKKMITIDSPYIREHAKDMDPATREVRVIQSALPFSTVMQIYDNRVSYITLTDQQKIGVIIEDASIYKMHKTIFEYIWEKATPLGVGKIKQPISSEPAV